MTVPGRDVEFTVCDGTILRGWHYPTQEKSPCIILSHGLAGIRHWFLPAFASRFQESGFAVLLYDNRNWGDSDGTPRQESNSILQQLDHHDALNYAITLPSVDTGKMVYWGINFSGDNVIYAAAIDKRIKAAIVQAPSVSGETRSLAFKDQIPGLFDDRVRIAAGGQQGRVPCITDTAELAQRGTAPVLFPICTRTNPTARSPAAAGSGKTM